MTFPADPRLHPGAVGTVETLLAVDFSRAQGQEPLCVMQHGTEETGINWRISYLPARGGFSFDRGDGGEAIEFGGGLRSREYVHLAFVTTGRTSHIVVDGVLMGGRDQFGAPQDTEPFAYLPPRPEGRPLLLGCGAGAARAPAYIAALRIWSRAIDRDTLQRTRAHLAFPADADVREEDVSAYAVLTDRRLEMRYPESKIAFTDLAGAPRGTPFFLARPPGRSLAAVYAARPRNFAGSPPGSRLAGAPARGVSGLLLEYGHPERMFEMATQGVPEMPQFVGLTPRPLPDLAQASYLSDVVASLLQRGLEFEAAELREPLVEAQRAARREWLGLFDQEGVQTVAVDDQGREVLDVMRLSAVHSDSLVRIAGLHDGRSVTMLRLQSARGTDERFDGERFGHEVFTRQIPLGAVFEGIAGTHVDGEVTSIALAYSMPAHPDVGTLPWQAADGIWVDRDVRAPARVVDAPGSGDDSPLGSARLISGNYENQQAYRIQYDAATRQIVLYVTRPEETHDPNDLLNRDGIHRFQYAEGRLWPHVSLQGAYLIVEDDRLHWFGADRVYERTLVRPAPYPEPHAQQLPWGATFSLAQRPPSIEANFRSYHPYRMRARDYEATTGTDKFVFRLPDEASQDYTTTGAHVIVPNGMLFRRDVKGSEQQDSHSMETAEQRHTQWSIGLGVNVGVPLLFSFAEDVNYTQGQELMRRTNESLSLTRTIATNYAFVMDLARVKLHPEFEARIYEMRDLLLTDRPRDWRAFFNVWGTHYPYAVTYGGMAWMEAGSDALAVNETNNSEIGGSVSASGTFEEIFQIGGKVNGSYAHSTSQGGGSESRTAVFGSNGGSFSRGGGWSLGHGEEVPLLLDLRKLTELLNPVMFDDPAVFWDLRLEMETELDTYVKSLADSVQTSGWASIRADNELERR